MTLSIQEISDRLEIQDVLVGYSHAIDTRDWDALDEVFTEDAVVDYTATGGSRGDMATTKEFLVGALAGFAVTQHLVAASKVTIEGDTAEARTMCHNPMVLDTGDGSTHVFFCGFWYRDQLVRTPAGWRIRSRVLERGYFHNLPPGFEFLEQG
jgi:3-phenylpropionate/cinnamic acid dioxygenase small subunit